jgi:hypothetical protein
LRRAGLRTNKTPSRQPATQRCIATSAPLISGGVNQLQIDFGDYTRKAALRRIDAIGVRHFLFADFGQDAQMRRSFGHVNT